MKLKGKKISDLALPLQNEVKCCTPDFSIGEALAVLQDNRIGSMVIVNSKYDVLGIFTERDYLLKIAGSEDARLAHPIENYMTPNPKSVQLSDSVYKATLLMRMGKFRHVVVTDEENKLVSVISVKDVMDFLMDSLEAQ